MKLNQLKENDIVHIELKETYKNYHPLLHEFDAKVKFADENSIIIFPPVAKASADWVITKLDINSLSL